MVDLVSGAGSINKIDMAIYTDLLSSKTLERNYHNKRKLARAFYNGMFWKWVKYPDDSLCFVELRMTAMLEAPMRSNVDPPWHDSYSNVSMSRVCM